MHAKSLQSCPTLCDPMDCSPPGSSVHGILQARILEWLPFPSPGDLPNPGIKPTAPAEQTGSVPLNHWVPLRDIQEVTFHVSTLGGNLCLRWSRWSWGLSLTNTGQREGSFLWREDGVLEQQSSRCGPKPEHRLRTCFKCIDGSLYSSTSKLSQEPQWSLAVLLPAAAKLQAACVPRPLGSIWESVL